jgi:hypothetical protein
MDDQKARAEMEQIGHSEGVWPAFINGGIPPLDGDGGRRGRWFCLGRIPSTRCAGH